MRILTITQDANLAVGLSLRLGDDAEVETVRRVVDLDVERHATFDVVLIALGTAARGVLAAGAVREHLGDVPCVIVAPEPPADLPAGITAIAPPFDMDAVRAELDRAVVGGPPPDARGEPTPLGSDGVEQRNVRRLVTDTSGGDSEEERPARERSRHDRLAHGLVTASGLQRLVDEIPQLNDRHAIADALIHEVTDGVDDAAAVLWGPDGAGGFEALAWHGVPGAIADLMPAADQPLLRDALDSDAVFLEPEERRPGYTDGLPGLRGGTIIAAALRTPGETHGVVVASGRSYAREDLIGLCALADEHAMALAIAAHLELLRHRAAVDLRERWRGHRLT